MAIIWKRQPSFRKIQYSSAHGEIVQNRDDFATERRSTGAKVAGGFITLPGGTRFRRATALDRYNSRLQVGAPASMTGKSNNFLAYGSPAWVLESAGGVCGDDILVTTVCGSKIDGSAVVDAQGGVQIPLLMRNEAVTKALTKLADQKANLGEDLATIKQTINLIRNPAQALYNGLKSVYDKKSLRPLLTMTRRSLDRKGPLTRAAEEYLKYVYGWKPLMQDIYGLIELAKEQGLISPLLLHTEATSRRSSDLPAFVYDNVSAGSRTEFKGGSENARVNCSLWARLDPSHAGLRALNQCGLVNPASLAWELVSWSFVVDWFVPIGPVLTALTAPAGLIFVDGTISCRASASGGLNVWSYFAEDRFILPYSLSKATATWAYDGYNRQVLPDWPLPGFWYCPDPFGLETGLNDRPIKALALAITNLRSIR
jgi:hypothetical protein